jgi:hypothetical protein
MGVWCSVPWCLGVAQRSRPTTAPELRGLCRGCDGCVRNGALGWGLAEARRRHDARRQAPSAAVGACDGCGAPGAVPDLDGGAWCGACARGVIVPRVWGVA